MKDFDVAQVRNECRYAVLAVILAYKKKYVGYQIGFPPGGERRNFETTVKKAYE
jgi:hypothetical protein